jgi:hypothetical protein
MQHTDARTQWEGAAPGWARWEATIAAWMAPATEAMLDMAGVIAGARVLDLASGAGSFTIEQRILSVPLRMPSAEQALATMQEAFGAYRAVVSDCPEAVRLAAWSEVAEALRGFEAQAGFEAPAEVRVVSGLRIS